MISRTVPLALQTAGRSWLCRVRQPPDAFRRPYSSGNKREDQPLQILFCGSDDFSACSLRALYHYSRLASSNIATIDVATRPDKRVGRNRQNNIASPPIKHAAEQLMLPVHQFDTFRGWELPKLMHEEKSGINMVIAVSFGLFVPPRILQQCEYGGLNVHPSLLPDLKGSSPIEHAIMNGDSKTGITVQTLHETKFDEGEIILQTPKPGISIPDPDSITAPQLKDILADIGAQMLVQTIRDKLYLNPQRPTVDLTSANGFRMAPKLSTESQHVDFANMNSVQILRLKRALGELWAVPVVPAGTKGMSDNTRLKFRDSQIRLARRNEIEDIPPEVLTNIEPGRPFCIGSVRERIETSMAPLLVKAADGEVLAIPQMIVSGMPLANATALASRAQLFEDDHTILEASNRRLARFRHKLA